MSRSPTGSPTISMVSCGTCKIAGRTLADPDIDRAVGALSKVVLDAEGGTRIGHALQEFLGSTRHLTTARGALVIVLSDGLERGEPRQLRSAVHRLSMVGHRLLWWSPLACEPNYRPVTAGMAAIVEYLDGLAGVRDLETAWTQVNARFRSRRPTTFPR